MSRLAVRTTAALAVILPLAFIARSDASQPAALPAPAYAGAAASVGEETAVLAGGCFWGIEAVFEHVKGVVDVVSGYAGGSKPDARYERVSSGRTGHAEAVRITFDPSQVSYGDLLRVFFSVAHDPTQLNRQGPDVGPQYRSVVFFANDDQAKVARAYIAQLEREEVFDRPIVTEAAALDEFFEAEAYHQDYMAHHPNQPYVVIHDRPKVERLRAQFPELYRDRK
jgi:peptide-methionine (S)-S-oxide reductase